MGGVNKAILIGRLGKDAEVRVTPGGQSVAKFSMATSEKYTDKSGQKVEKTEWHNIVLWGKLADVLAKYLTKGKEVYVEGKIETRSWEKDGVKRYSTDINAQNITLLGGGQRDGGGQRSQDDGFGGQTAGDGFGGGADPAPVTDDDIPF